MTQFEFIFVFVSIVMGLALADFLGGFTRSVQQPKADIDLAHLGFTVSGILSLVVVWWGMWRFASVDQWDYFRYLAVLAYGSSFYGVAQILYPKRRDSIPRFEEIRTGAFGFGVFILILEIPYLTIVGDWNDPAWYPYLSGLLGAALITGIVIRQTWYDRLLAATFVAIWAFWSIAFRFFGA